MKITIGKKEVNIKFGYKPTLKERVISKIAKLGDIRDETENINLEKLENLLLYLPELLLVGMQVHHKEYRYDYDTGEGKAEALEKACALVEEYMDSEGADVLYLFNALQEALTEDSFLSAMLQRAKNEQAGANES